MKKLLLVLSCLLMTTGLFAKEEGLEISLLGSIGVTGNYGIQSDWNSNDWEIAFAGGYWPSVDAVENDPSAGGDIAYNFGLGLNYFVSPNFAFTFSGIYDTRNYIIKWAKNPSYADVEDIKLHYKNLKYFTFNFGIRGYTDSFWFFGAGGYYSILASNQFDFKLEGKIVNSGEITSDGADGSNLLKDDAGCFLELGYAYPISEKASLDFSLKFNLGLKNIIESSSSSAFVKEAKNFALYATIGLSFGL